MTGVARSQRLIAFRSTAASNSGIWYGPEDHVTLVKSLYARNDATVDVELNLVAATADGSVTVRVATVSMPPLSDFAWEGWFVIHPGDAAYVNVSGAEVSAWVSGAVLSGGPQFPPVVSALPAGEPHS